MGIYIHLNISNRVTEDEWARAYQKSVCLMKKMPFMEKTVKTYHGAKLVCVTKTIEKEWFGEIGWHTIGDSVSLKTAEDYFLPKDIARSDKEGINMKPYVDPYMSILPEYAAFDFEDERCHQIIHLWGDKTQAKPYHFYLLAVACMLEYELPGKVAIYGDITKGQCRKALRIVSELSGEQIELPDRCDLHRLYARVRKMPLHKDEIVDAFVALYMGNLDKDFGTFARRRFTAEEFEAYWRKKFEHSKAGTLGFLDYLKSYLLWGFQITELKKYVQLEDEEDKDLAEKFVREVLDTEVFLENKNCKDVLEIDHELEESYSIYTLLAQLVFAGAKNYRVDRYIPLKELIAELKGCVGDHCNVDTIVTDYMKERGKKAENENPVDLLINHMIDKVNTIISEKKEWDITDAEELLSYKTGDTIASSLNGMLLVFFKFYRKILEEVKYKILLEKGAQASIRYLIEQNMHFLFMEEAWDKIIAEIEDNAEAFERYYPMVRVKLTGDLLIPFIQAIVLNDELYQYCMENYSKVDSE